MGEEVRRMANFEALNVLAGAPSKDFVGRMVREAYRHRIEGVPSRVVETAAGELSCSAADAKAMYATVLHVVRLALYDNLDAAEVLALFPEGFRSDLAKLLTKAVVAQLSGFRDTAI